MKLFLKNILLFAFILILVYPVLIFCTGNFVPQLFKPNINYYKGSYGHLYTRLKEIKDSEKKTDVLFLGSSHTYRGFDPRNFEGVHCFNLGSSAQTPINTKVLLKRYLHGISPRVVFYEVYPENFIGDGVESSLDLIANDENDFCSVKMAFDINNIKTYNTLIYGFYCEWFQPGRSFKENVIKDKDRYISGGYVEREVQYNRVLKKKVRSNWCFSAMQLNAFKENLDLLRSKNIETILVFAPIAPYDYRSHTNNKFVDSLMNSYGLPYYNFNELMQLNDSIDFYDAHHLNQIGVNKFNLKMKEIFPKILM